MEKELHKPVLLQEVIEYLDIKPGDVVVDATFGFGGHSKKILEKLSRGRVIGIEKDNQVIEKSAKAFLDNRITVVNDDFLNLEQILKKQKIKKIDKIIFDLGISSFHFDLSGRGFTFQRDEPLDMRIDQGSGVTAADLVNGLSKNELADLLFSLGDERFSRQIAREILERRKKKKFETSLELAHAVQAVKRPEGKINPATKTFQALRIAVNNELGVIQTTLPKAIKLLSKEGRIAVISFHSGEDRIVKNIFKTLAKEGEIEILTKKPVTAQYSEQQENPRSRSAKLRVAKRRK